METKHSAGPWEVVRNDGAYVKRADLATLRIDQTPREDDLALALIITDCDRLKEEAEANARLIAAAPDLLAACQAFRRAMRGRGDIPLPPDFCRDLVAALGLAIEATDRATGEAR